ncbi:MAG: alanine--glyoxylate aminotransferase family protein [Anaerolineae bacterium]|nr:alanine--glyoxylate aminotransferase family protein [Anaerolineae bacterium]
MTISDDNSLLMIPGPIQPEKQVLAEMGKPVRVHYGPEFTQIYKETIAMLKPVFGTQQADVFLLVGPGTAGNDAAIGSALSSGEKIIVGVNGFFGERLKLIAENYNLQVITVASAWGTPLDPQSFADAIRSHPDAKAIAVVHLETSTTILNPIVEIGQLAKQHGLLYIVDAVSSLGSMAFDMDGWGIDLCVSATQKCLGALPGLAPIAVSPYAWEVIDRNPNKGHGFLLNLQTWRYYTNEWSDWHPFPITMTAHTVMALRAALISLQTEGIENRQERYRRLALRLREGLRRIGLPPFTPDDLMTPVITAGCAPQGVPAGKLVAYLSEEHHIKISTGLGPLRDTIFRIGHMSPILTETEIDWVIHALSKFQGV